MLTKRLFILVPRLFKQSFQFNVPALYKSTDPIQQLFLDKIKEYKSKSAGGKLETPESKKEREAELNKVAKQYGGGEGVDMTAFPKFSFKEPKIELSHTSSEK